MKRPLRHRFWFYKPDPSIDEFSWRYDLRPVWFGDDEYHWKTIVVGTRWTGSIVFALYQWNIPCEECGLEGYPGWPISYHEWLWPDEDGDRL